jgi:hypothetical protein
VDKGKSASMSNEIMCDNPKVFLCSCERFMTCIEYAQEELTLRQSRFGLALVVRTLRSSGGFILGFRTEPPEAQQELFDTLQRLHTVYTADPVLGVRYTVEDTVSARRLVCCSQFTSCRGLSSAY